MVAVNISKYYTIILQLHYRDYLVLRDVMFVIK